VRVALWCASCVMLRESGAMVCVVCYVVSDRPMVCVMCYVA